MFFGIMLKYPLNQDALKRIEADEFGWCVSCGDEIALKRLELDPATPTCIECASKAS